MSNESPNEFFVQAGWAAMWNPESDYYLPNVIKNGINKEGVKVDALGNIDLGSVPSSGSFQLMKSDNLASWLPVKTGYVGIQFTGVKVSNFENITNDGLTYTDVSDSKGKINAKIKTPTINVTGSYQLVATGLAKCALDSAAILPGGLTAKKMATNEEDPNDFLDTARAQRTKLWQTKNGGKFMDSYYDHNEVFNFTFQKNAGLKNSWTQPANQHFMQTTNDSAKNTPDADVNTGTYTSNNKALGDDDMTYNKNAFNQKIAVANAAFGYSMNPPSETNITKQQFSDAANAAMTFNNTVGDTGNTSDKTTPMSINKVYDTIQNGEQYESVAKRMTPMDHKSFLASLTKEEKAYLKKMEATEYAMLKSNSDASATLLTGTFEVVFASGDLTLDADLDFQTSPELKATATVNSFTSDAKVTKVEIHNMNVGWMGLKSIGSKLIEAYNNSSQIESLMQDKINSGLGSDEVKNYITNWINTTFQKLLGAY